MVPGMTQLQMYSIGVVAANKTLTSKHIEVTPIEESPMLEGEITDNEEAYEAKGESPDGEAFQTELKTTASIRALWLPFGDTNRMTSPNVRRGERVAIYRFGDADEYFWTTLTQHHTLRRLETVVWAFSNNSKENIENDSTCTYYFEVSTHTKRITLHTAKNDGEFCEYTFQINAKDGNFTFEDDIGNFVFLDSKEKQIKLRNVDESYIDINKRIITIHSLDKIIMKTKHLEIDAGSSITTKTQTFSESTSTYTMQASNYTTSTNGYKINAPTVNFSANIDAGGTVKGSTISGGSYQGGHH